MESFRQITLWGWQHYWARIEQDLPAIMIFLAANAVVFLLEIMVLGWRDSSLYRILCRRSKSVETDLFYFLADVFKVKEILSLLFSFGLAKGLIWILQHYASLNLMVKIPSITIQVILAFIIQDFIAYWLHRFFHQADFWWELHRVHHSATDFNVFTAVRTHPLESAAQGVGTALTLVLTGISFNTYLLVIILLKIHPALIHSMLPWDWGRVGKYLVISPMAHRVHHSAEKRHFNKNFGAVLTVWDHLFGTFEGEVIRQPVLGEAGKVFNQRFFVTEQFQAFGRMAQKTYRLLNAPGSRIK